MLGFTPSRGGPHQLRAPTSLPGSRASSSPARAAKWRPRHSGRRSRSRHWGENDPQDMSRHKRCGSGAPGAPRKFFLGEPVRSADSSVSPGRHLGSWTILY
ncbi:hypothetical protein NDU88_008228 [Pleurodeles waltl]|uniref:Uncharacterized protein n=1 Tax=Pleurodeles waltl TaxID=8319 RepID=A0AAV7RU53_PLEWA|nr:hypothetical protein NDU88_008228 [Pleurodeles waltl]